MVIKNRRVMIACVTMETVVVSNPVIKSEYNPDIVYLIHYYNKNNKSSEMYIQFYNQVVENIGDKAEIIECNKKVYLFDEMLKTILGIIESEEGNHVYINISSGTSEYSAAAIIASLMHNDRTHPFTVNADNHEDKETGEIVRGFTLSDEEFQEHFFVDGKPMGQIMKTKPPSEIMTFHLDRPDDYLIKGLKILADQKKPYDRDDEITYSPTKMIELLTEQKVWFRTFDENTSDSTKLVYYSRDFVKKWLEKRWVERNEHSKKIMITELGKTMLRIFYFDENIDYISMEPGKITMYEKKDIDEYISTHKGELRLDNSDQ